MDGKSRAQTDLGRNRNALRQIIQARHFDGIFPSAPRICERLGRHVAELAARSSTASDVDISSIGVAENFIGREYGSDEWGVVFNAVSVGVDILTPQAVCFVWTFRDQLNFNVVYNEAFHEKEQMERFVETVKRIVLCELKVEENN